MHYKIQMPDGSYSAGGTWRGSSAYGKTWISFKAFSSHLSAMRAGFMQTRYKDAKIMFFSENGQSGSIPFNKYAAICEQLAKPGIKRAAPEVVAKHLGLHIHDEIKDNIEKSMFLISEILPNFIINLDDLQKASQEIRFALNYSFGKA